MENYSTERLFLREIQIDDLNDRVMLWFEDKELMKYYSTSQKNITQSSLIEYIEKGKDDGTIFTFGIFDTVSSVMIGTLKLGPINHIHKISDLVTLIGDRNFLGKGLAVDAIKLGNKMAFDKFDLRKLYGGMYESNIPSIKAYRRAGWLVEGRLKGHYCIDDKAEDRILVGCFNPVYFSSDDINSVKENEYRFL